MKQSVPQQHEMSCGLACISYITSIQYDKIAKGEEHLRLTQRGYSCIALVRKLDMLGYKYSWRKCTNENVIANLSTGSIVFVEPSEDLPYGHWLTLAQQGWMDPWINYASSRDISQAQSGFRESLPGRPSYLVIPRSRMK